MDPWRNLPNEIFEKVLKDIEAEDLKTVGSVSREWRNFVDTDWALWKHHCCRALNRDILDKEILQELSWKDIFKQNYRKNGVLKRSRAETNGLSVHRRNHSAILSIKGVTKLSFCM